MITEKSLLANGWVRGLIRLKKPISNRLELVFYKDMVYLCFDKKHVPLPHVDTLEKLSRLERFLSPCLVMDTAPIDVAIRARFAEGGGDE